MKKLISGILICLMMTVFTAGGALDAYAAGPVDTQKGSSITIQYRLDGEAFEGAEVRTYHVADVDSYGVYTMNSSFSEYSVNVNGIGSQAAWSVIADTLAAYAVADGLEPSCTGVTDSTGTVSFRDLKPGLYMTLYVDITEEDRIITFDSFMTAVPFPDASGSYDYDVTAYPKGSTLETGGDDVQDIQYKVVKQWKDAGYTDIRPEAIEIQVFRGEELVYTQQLSEDNDWTFSWTSEDDGSQWLVVERNIKEDYAVTVTNRDTVIILTNEYAPEETGEEFDPFEEDEDKDDEKDKEKKEPVPQTGDTVNMWTYVLTMCFAGGVSIIAALWRRRME